MNTSFPKSKMPVMLTENIQKKAVTMYEKDGYPVSHYKTSIAPEELVSKVADYSVLGIRSKTAIPSAVIASAKKLLALGVYCIGTNHIDIKSCTEAGIPIFNAPYSNTRSVAEMVLGDIIVLHRGIIQKSSAMHGGKWSKGANGFHEIRGRKLGIVGYGKIGSQLSTLAEALGMHVYYYDIEEKLALGNARKCKTLTELLKLSDVVSLHVDGRSENENLMNGETLAHMKRSAFFINASRGMTVDEDALLHALKAKKIAGAALDVYKEEPGGKKAPFRSPFAELDNVILTSHDGASTEEAQKNIADFTTARVLAYLNTGNTMMSINFPNLNLPRLDFGHRVMHIHKNVPGVLANLNEVFAKGKINITGQYLKTNETIGYVVTDIEGKHPEDVIEKVKKVPHTIRARILY